MRFKADIMDEATMMRTLMRMAHQITEKNKGVEDVCIVGIERRGKPLAEQLGPNWGGAYNARNIGIIEGKSVPCGHLDIHYYRDDLTPDENGPVFKTASLPFEVVNKKIVLVDDVLYTGRTVRAAIEAVFSLGRPKEIQLAILIDRGHRELPIRADYVGKNIPTSGSEIVSVRIPPIDSETGVVLYDRS